MVGMDIWLTKKQMRRPDVTYFTAEQIQQMSAGETVITGFVIEFSSGSDDVLKSIKKLHEYFAARVQVVWWVYPVYREVYVYTSPKTITICTGVDLISAAPALPELLMTADELFQR